MRLVELL